MIGNNRKGSTNIGVHDNRHYKRKTHTTTYSLDEFHRQFSKDAENLYANFWMEKAKKSPKTAKKLQAGNGVKKPEEKLSNGHQTPLTKSPISNGVTNGVANSSVDSFSCSGRGRGGRIRSCPRLPTPPRCVPRELKSVDSMTSADFRHDFRAHLENMRVHQKDQQHMQFFQSTIEDNKHLFVGRCILVLCCGPGTLALMVARAGAARVYAMDYSNVTDYARLVVKENHYERVIRVLHGRVADIKLQQELQVDGIVCNWMGHCLLYESELVQLLQARDRWLKPNGFILPDLGALYMMGGAGQALNNERCNWWLNVYGFKMNAMRSYALAEPRFARIQGDQLLTLAHKVMNLDLRRATLKDLQIDRNIRLQAQQAGYLECFVLYFDVAFSRAHQPQKLSCNPWLGSQLSSLWLQTLLFVEQPFLVRPEHSYVGQLIFKSLQETTQLSQLNLNEMKIEIVLQEHTGMECNPRVQKRWLMLSRFQSVQEVQDCRDRHLLNELN